LKKIILLICFHILFARQTGTLSGLIRDVSTHQPLIGVNVIVSETDKGSATDTDGYFTIENIPVNSYVIHVSMIGYEQVKRANIHIVPKRYTFVNFDLHPEALQGGVVEVTATYFEKAKDAFTSSRSVDIEEIRSDPVGSYDIMAMMQALPSVVSGSDQTNEIIVRGGSHGENLFVIDFLEIPYPNHYPEQSKGGGPITMVDTEFIERIDFFAGAFPSRYGEKLSSVMDISLREGSRKNHHQQIDMNMAGFGLTAEGPINNKSSYIYSLKRSFLDFVISSSGMQAIPKYWTSQGKITYHISPTEKLYFNFIGGIDEINIEGEEGAHLRDAENVAYSSWQSTFGITYKNLFSKKGYFITSLGNSWVNLNTDVYKLDENVERDIYYHQFDLEKDLSFRSEIVYHMKKGLDVSGGLTAKMVNLDYDNWYEDRPKHIYGYSLDSTDIPTIIDEDMYYSTYYNNPATIVTELTHIGSTDLYKTESLLEYEKVGGFVHMNWVPIEKLEAAIGGRLDHLNFTGATNFSPRIGFKYHLSSIFKLNFSAGRYFQNPFNVQLNSTRGTPDNLRNYFADQAVGGLEYFPKSDTRITLEYYEKKYEDMVTFELLEGSDGKDSLNWTKLVNDGKGQSNGIEVFIQKKYSHDWYGSISWSHSFSEGVDPRTNKYYPWDYDYRNVVNVVGGYKIRYSQYSWYESYKKSWVAKAFSWLPFMPSDEYEISIKYRYMGGRPYTPKRYDPTIREWYSNSTDEWNTERYDHYSRFDLMIQQRFNFEKVNLVAFWNIMNVANRKNEHEYVYLEDGSKEMNWQYTTMPVGGFILEF